MSGVGRAGTVSEWWSAVGRLKMSGMIMKDAVTVIVVSLDWRLLLPSTRRRLIRAQFNPLADSIPRVGAVDGVILVNNAILRSISDMCSPNPTRATPTGTRMSYKHICRNNV